MPATPDAPHHGSRILLVIVIAVLATLALLTRHDHDSKSLHNRPTAAEQAGNLARIATFNARVIALTREADDAQQALKAALAQDPDSAVTQTALARYQSALAHVQTELKRIETPTLALPGYENSLRDTRRQLTDHFTARQSYPERWQRLARQRAELTLPEESGKPSRGSGTIILMHLQDPYLAMGYDANDIDSSTMTLRPGALPITRLPD